MKLRCNHCNNIATWIYMPSDGEGQCCDNCVPRGCSCNIIYSNKLYEDGFPKPLLDERGNPIQEKDEHGRLYPCCEWDYDPFGHDEFDEDDLYRFMRDHPELDEF
jgi:hypothetical protein